MSRPRYALVCLGAAAALAVTACSSDDESAPEPSTATNESADAAGSGDAVAPADQTDGAEFVVGQGSGPRDRSGSFTVTGDPAESICTASDSEAVINITDPAPADGVPEWVIVEGSVDAGAGPGRVSIQYNTTDAGNTLSADSREDGDEDTEAQVEITVDGDQVSATFTATTWDDIEITGTATCTLA